MNKFYKTGSYRIQSHTEKKLIPFCPPPHRQSISERKAIPQLEDKKRLRRSQIPQPMAGARKALNFKEKENVKSKPAATFAKPRTPSPLKIDENEFNHGRSLAELVRDGLMFENYLFQVRFLSFSVRS